MNLPVEATLEDIATILQNLKRQCLGSPVEVEVLVEKTGRTSWVDCIALQGLAPILERSPTRVTRRSDGWSDSASP